MVWLAGTKPSRASISPAISAALQLTVAAGCGGVCLGNSRRMRKYRGLDENGQELVGAFCHPGCDMCPHCAWSASAGWLKEPLESTGREFQVAGKLWCADGGGAGTAGVFCRALSRRTPQGTKRLKRLKPLTVPSSQGLLKLFLASLPGPLPLWPLIS